MFGYHRIVPFFCALILATAMVLPGAASAQSPPIPDVLSPWVDWVLYDAPNLACPQLRDGEITRPCDWPGVLEIYADGDGAQFMLRAWRATPGELTLPGDAEMWPRQVRVDGRFVVVGERDGSPIVEVEAGAFEISGDFVWESVPRYLGVPPDVGNLVLEINGEDVDRPRLDAQGQLRLDAQESSDEDDEADRVRASIYRRIEDGTPLRIITRVELNVSGKAREIDLGNVFVDGSRPISLDSPLPVEIDGRSVAVYARPGSHMVTLEAVVTDPAETLSVPDTGLDFYDDPEVWLFVPDDEMRSVELAGLSAVDPARTSLPDDWRHEMTYLAAPGEALALDETRRGASQAPNSLNLSRSIWLDVDGDGLTIQDRLSGTLQRDWRLDYAGPAELGRVYDQSSEVDLLITEHPNGGHSGVEIRDRNVDVVADLRLDNRRLTLPAVGWAHDVESLSTTLHLPPGWTLLAATGTDELSGKGTLESWTLWHFFFVLIVALVVGKLLGWKWAPLALLALVLSHEQPGAPMWVWIHLIVSLALLRALPNGWWRKGVHVYRVIVLLVLFGLLASFAHDQIRMAIHPQVSSTHVAYGDRMAGLTMGDQASAPQYDDRFAEYEEKPMDLAAPGEQTVNADEDDAYAAQGIQTNSLRSDVSSTKMDLNQIDPNAVVQTGPGMPDWHWQNWQLRWSGPVHGEHEMRLWLVSPMVNRILALLRIALLIVLALILLSPRDMAWRKPDDGEEKDGDKSDANSDKKGGESMWRHLIQPMVLVLVLSIGTAAAPPEAHAQSESMGAPSQALLETLRERIVDAQTCDGPCVVVSHADFDADGPSLTMSAEVHAQMDAGWYLPGPSAEWQIDQVRIDGVQTTQLRRQPAGLTAVRIPQGRHTLEVRGTLSGGTSATLRMGENRPHHVRFSSDDWSVDGLNTNGVPDDSLHLTRTDTPDAAAPAGEDSSQELPEWYQVHRHVGLGLPWQMRTTITREDASQSRLLRLPLLDGESVITDGPRTEDGEVLVDFPRNERVIEYISELPIEDQVALRAPQDRPWTETWQVECSRIWRCHFSELPPTRWVDDGAYLPTWMPWPGESLRIDVARPAGVAGQSSTVDNVEYRVKPGKRLLEAQLTLTIRASQGSTQTVTLPEDAEIKTTKIGGDERSLRIEDRQLELPIRPGEHTYEISWQQPWEPSITEKMPEINIGSAATNVDLYIERRGERWLLHTMGPPWGPAVLFWPHLAMLLVLALLLSSLRGLPLKPYEWVLLLLGLSQLPYLALIPVVGWFALMTLRQKRPANAWWKFNLGQIFLVGLTIVAALSLYAGIHANLLFDVDMQVSGADSTSSLLHWSIDRTDGVVGRAGILSIPMWIWRALMLAWAFWLVSRLLNWVPWGWKSFSTNGLWKRRKKKGDSADKASAPKISQDDEPANQPPPDTDGKTSPS